MNLRLFAALLASCCALPAAALLIRPDRDDAEYLELATRYPSFVALTAVGGSGVLIAPRWVLTTAHGAKGMKDRKLALDGRDHAVAAVFIHPDWKPGGGADVALLLLAEPARGVEPTRLYRDQDEAGKGVVVVGNGATGRIGATARQQDGRKRAAINTVDRVAPDTLGLRIKPLDEASDLQGAITPSDRGGPAFLENDAGTFVAGIARAAEGDWNLYARASTFVTWIEATMLQVAKQEAEALLAE